MDLVRQSRPFPYRPGLPRWIGSARPSFPYRLVAAMDLYLVRPNDVLPEKVRLRVICPAEGRFGGENRLSAQIRPEPGFDGENRLSAQIRPKLGFGGQMRTNKDFVRQPRPFPNRCDSERPLVRQRADSRTKWAGQESEETEETEESEAFAVYAGNCHSSLRQRASGMLARWPTGRCGGACVASQPFSGKCRRPPYFAAYP